MFRNRAEAGRKLAKALDKYRGQRPLVLAVPRGAVTIGRTLADALDGELDLLFVRKLRAPGSHETAVGAIDESAKVYVADNAAELGADDDYLEREKAVQLGLIRASRAACGAGRARIDAAGRVVIVVDDGLATGLTMIAALRAARSRDASWVVCAVPVAAPRGLVRVRPYCDEIAALAAPHDFYGVSVYYEEFRQVTDADVAALLRSSAPALR